MLPLSGDMALPQARHHSNQHHSSQAPLEPERRPAQGLLRKQPVQPLAGILFVLLLAIRPEGATRTRIRPKAFWQAVRRRRHKRNIRPEAETQGRMQHAGACRR